MHLTHSRLPFLSLASIFLQEVGTLPYTKALYMYMLDMLSFQEKSVINTISFQVLLKYSALWGVGVYAGGGIIAATLTFFLTIETKGRDLQVFDFVL